MAKMALWKLDQLPDLKRKLMYLIFHKGIERKLFLQCKVRQWLVIRKEVFFVGGSFVLPLKTLLHGRRMMSVIFTCRLESLTVAGDHKRYLWSKENIPER